MLLAQYSARVVLKLVIATLSKVVEHGENYFLR